MDKIGIKLKEDIGRRDVMLFVGLLVALLLWALFTNFVILQV